MKSIRAYLLSRLLGGAAIVLAAAGVVVYVLVRRSLESEFDRELSQRIQGFASLLFQTKDELEFEFSDELMPEYDRGKSPAYFELWLADGSVLERSNSLTGRDLAIEGAVSMQARHWTAALPDGRTGRFVARRIEVHHVYPEEGPDRPQAASVTVVVARGREELVGAERTLLAECVLVALALLALLALLAWRAVERGLQPAKRLAQALDAIDVQRVPERLELGELPAELRPMADTSDALIQRVHDALERERRTTADIAHELRTPLSELLTVSEVALRDERDPRAMGTALRTVRDVAWRMARAVSTLLKLARLEMGSEALDREPVDLGALVAELLRSLSSLQRERELRVATAIEPGELVEGDPEALRIVVSNLLSNALYYSPARGTIECRLVSDERGWSFAVENDAPDLRPEDLLALAQPFWRKDRARSDRSRSGLGLALSRSLAEKSGLTLAFELEGGRFRAFLRGPAGTHPNSAPRAAARVHTPSRS